jgi:transcriptional regulator with XRE-family HTH domain
METGKLIKELRIKKGITQEELADLTELSARTIQRIENGEVDPHAYTLQMIAKALEVDFSIFTENESNEDEDLEDVNKRNWLALIHLSGLLPLFFPTIIIWNRKKAEIKEITDHYNSVIRFQLTNLLVILGGIWIFYATKRPVLILIILLFGGFQAIRNTLKVINGKPYKYYFIFKDKNSRTRPT